MQPGTKTLHDFRHFRGIVRMHRNPYIHIHRGARVSVVTDGIPANQQIFNAGAMQQFQELSEVGR
jgi:hypothetical protein